MRNLSTSIVCAFVLVLSACSGGGGGSSGGVTTNDAPDGGPGSSGGLPGTDGGPTGPGGPVGTPAPAKCVAPDAEYAGIAHAKQGAAPAGCPSAIGADGTLTLTMNAGEPVALATSGGAITANGVACGAAADIKSLVVFGTTGDDTLVVDLAEGAIANVHVDLGGGTDAFQVKGSPAADQVTASAAKDGRTAFDTTLDGKPELDVANAENFTISLGAGDDAFDGTGAAVAFTVYGGAGNDTLAGGAKDDALCGGAGDDTFRTAAAPDGADQYEGGDGTDTADFGGRTGALTIALDDVADDGEKDEHDDVRASTENVTGGAGDDRVTGSAAANVLRGGDGDDTFDEGDAPNGADVIDGGNGSDTVLYTRRTGAIHVALCEPPAPCLANNGEVNENDTLLAMENAEGGSGDDVLVGNSASNTLDGNGGDDHIDGQDGDDYLYGDDGADTLLGGNGDDYLDGAHQVDSFNGGAGDGDICVIENGETHLACELY